MVQLRPRTTAEDDALVLGDGAERPGQEFDQLGHVDRFPLEVQRSRFDLGEVEDLVDEVEQVLTRLLNRVGEFVLLVG